MVEQEAPRLLPAGGRTVRLVAPLAGAGIDARRALARRLRHRDRGLVLLVGLAANDLRGAAGNFLVCHPAGILGGVDHCFTGKVERVDTAMLKALLDDEIIPVVSPIGTDGLTT